MKKNLIVVLLIAASVSAFAQWNVVYRLSFYAKDISFVSRDTGFVGGNVAGTGYPLGAKVMRTVTGGYTWEDITGNLNGHITAICFLNSQKGFVGLYGSGIFITVDGGITWTQKFIKESPVDIIRFSSTQTGYAICSSYSWSSDEQFFDIIKTTDGGENWNNVAFFISSPGPGEATDASFPDDSTGYMTTAAGRIYKTTDGGNTWNIIINTPDTIRWNGISFTDANHGFAAGVEKYTHRGVILKTNDAGTTWEKISLERSVYDIDFKNNDTGFISSDGIQKTADGGNTWIADSCGADSPQPDMILFADNEIAYGLYKQMTPGSIIMKHDPKVGVGIVNPLNKNNIKIFPIPADKNLSVVSDIDLDNCRIELTDLSGKTIPLKLCSDRTKLKVLDVGGISDGIYLLKIHTESFEASGKVIIRH